MKSERTILYTLLILSLIAIVVFSFKDIPMPEADKSTGALFFFNIVWNFALLILQLHLLAIALITGLLFLTLKLLKTKSGNVLKAFTVASVLVAVGSAIYHLSGEEQEKEGKLYSALTPPSCSTPEQREEALDYATKKTGKTRKDFLGHDKELIQAYEVRLFEIVGECPSVNVEKVFGLWPEEINILWLDHVREMRQPYQECLTHFESNDPFQREILRYNKLLIIKEAYGSDSLENIGEEEFIVAQPRFNALLLKECEALSVDQQSPRD